MGAKGSTRRAPHGNRETLARAAASVTCPVVPSRTVAGPASSSEGEAGRFYGDSPTYTRMYFSET